MLFGNFFKKPKYVTVKPQVSVDDDDEQAIINCAECTESSVCTKARDDWHGEVLTKQASEEAKKKMDKCEDVYFDDDFEHEGEMPALIDAAMLLVVIFAAISFVALAIVKLLTMFIGKGDSE